jgi:elongation factor 1-gamma
MLSVAAVAGVSIKLDEKYEHMVTNKTPEYLAKFPIGKVPALEGADGFRLTEASAIARYVAKSSNKSEQLLGSTLEQTALIDQWISIAQDLTKHIYVHHAKPYFEPAGAKAREETTRTLKFLNTYLESRTFLVTERITLADITLALSLKSLFKHIVDKSGRESIGNVVRFFNTVANHPMLKEFIGEPEWLEKFVRPTGK